MPLVAHWPLHEDSGTTAHDIAGSNDGTNNGASVGSDGVLGTSAYVFNAEDVEANTTNYGIADGAQNPFSLSAWCYWDGSTNTVQGICQSPSNPGGSPGNPPYGMSLAQSGNNNLTLLIQDSADNGNLVSDPDPFPQNEWALATVTYDGSVARVFVNGSLKKESELGVGIYDVTSQSLPRGHTVGSWKRQDGRYWSGRLSDYRIYDHALTVAEVQYLYSVYERGTSTSGVKPL